MGIRQLIPSPLRALAKRLLILPPRGVRKFGKDSWAHFPRRFQGGQYIQIGERTNIYGHSWLCAIDSYAGEKYTPRIIIGNDVHIGQYACIIGVSEIVIGDGCVLSECIFIADLSHGIDPQAGLILEQKLVTRGSVIIGAHSFIGYRVCIMPGVTLGQHCVVGANSVVTHSFPDYSMVAGVPARLIKRYSAREGKWVDV